MYIHAYDGITAAGPTAQHLMDALLTGRDCSQVMNSETWGPAGGRVCRISGERTGSRAFLGQQFAKLWGRISPQLRAELKDKKVGVLFASTKGAIEDFIWTVKMEDIRQSQDPYSPVLEDFCKIIGNVSFRCSVNNACASVHVAIEYAKDLLSSDRLDYVVVIGADLAGPFVYKGFQALKLLSPTMNRPFDANRDGLQLGEAITMLVLGSEKSTTALAKIAAVASDTEATPVTRPSAQGLGLIRTMRKVVTNFSPDLVIAHGTGTKVNDQTEDNAMAEFFQAPVQVTGCKWSVGHSLGASGGIDIVAGCEILRQKKLFPIKNCEQPEPQYKMKYLGSKNSATEFHGKNILINSLGFGGVSASLVLQKLEKL